MEDLSGERWAARPRAARAVRVLAVVVPVVVAVAVGYGVALLVGRPEQTLNQILWLGVVFAVSGGTLIGVDRLARRALPLATLLELSLVFPDRTPSRFGVALRAGFTRNAEGKLALLRHQPPADTLDGILALIAALGSHDRRTRGHSERVRAFADLIAQEMKLPADSRDRLRWCAILHDIGKLEVERELLQSERPLDDEEWERVRRHPEEGARIISSFAPWLGEWAEAVAQHHERWDGRGYPLGLSGADIALGARIVSVADTFEVMTAGRAYSTAVSTAEARRELARCAGGQFDPMVVRAFLNVGLEPIGWIARVAAWFGTLTLVQRLRPDTPLGRVAHSGMAGGMSVALAAAAITGAAPLTPVVEPAPAFAEVAGVIFERPVDVEETGLIEVEPAVPSTVVEPPPPDPEAPPVTAPSSSPPTPLVEPPTTVPPSTDPSPPAPSPPAPGPPTPAQPAPALTDEGGIAVPDAVVEASGGTRIDVLANDGGGRELDLTTLEIVDPPDHTARNIRGATTLVVNATQIHYVPEPGFVGTDSITYRICTTDGECAATTVTINVAE